MGIALLDNVACFSPRGCRQSTGTSAGRIPADAVAFEGLLTYQSKDGAWKERWFVLDGSQNRLVKCTGTSDSRQRARSYGSVLGASGGVRVADVHAVSTTTPTPTSVPTAEQVGLDVVTTTGQRIRFRTKTQDDERAWVAAIHNLSHGFTREVTERLVDRELLAGKYALVRELGRGASGIVSLYTYQGKPFAIKKFVPQKAKGIPNRRAVPSAGGSRPTLGARVKPKSESGSTSEDQEIPEEVRREIALLKKASHLPYVIKLHDVIVDAAQRQYYLVMEYMGGGAIAEWDPERKCYARARNQKSLSLLDEKTVRAYMTNLLLGIQALHHNGLCHRDIKPENLMANEENTMCKIGDLGVAHYFHQEVNGQFTEEADPDNMALWDLTEDCADALSASGSGSQQTEPAQRPRKAMLKSTKGTYQFLPPEALSGDEFDGFKADVWAVGVTLYALLFGYLPFYSSDLVKLFEKIEHDAVVIPASCQDDEAKDLLLRILEKDPDKRISIEEMLAHKWLHRHVDSRALTQQVRALKRAPALSVEAHELGGAVSVVQLQSRFDQLSRAVKDNSLGYLRDSGKQLTASQSAVDADGLSSPAPMELSYTPKPIATSEIQLPAWLMEDVPALAAQLHFDWCLAKHVEGWAFGETRDDAARLHPLLVPMRNLPADAQLKNVQCVEETLKCVLALGCRMRKRHAPPSLRSRNVLPSDQIPLCWQMLMLVDLLAENSHEVWAAGYTQQGWRHGDVFDSEAKCHPSLKPYMALHETEKHLCRQGVSAVLKSCVYLGYEISCVRDQPKHRPTRKQLWSV